MELQYCLPKAMVIRLIFSFEDLSRSLFFFAVSKEKNKTIKGFPWFCSWVGIKNRRKQLIIVCQIQIEWSILHSVSYLKKQKIK